MGHDIEIQGVTLYIHAGPVAGRPIKFLPFLWLARAVGTREHPGGRANVRRWFSNFLLTAVVSLPSTMKFLCRSCLVHGRRCCLHRFHRNHTGGCWMLRPGLAWLLNLLELSQPVLVKATEPFSSPVRALDALHLASACLLQERRQPVRLATFDKRMARIGVEAGLELVDL